MKEKNNNVDIEVVIGDQSDLNFSDVKDCVNTLRPKDKKNIKKVIIPKTKNEKKKK